MVFSVLMVLIALILLALPGLGHARLPLAAPARADAAPAPVARRLAGQASARRAGETLAGAVARAAQGPP